MSGFASGIVVVLLASSPPFGVNISEVITWDVSGGVSHSMEQHEKHRSGRERTRRLTGIMTTSVNREPIGDGYER